MKKRKESSQSSFFGEKLNAANIGIIQFYEDLKRRKDQVCHIDWEPPAGGDQELTSILDTLIGR
jgi:hypothetical protein